MKFPGEYRGNIERLFLGFEISYKNHNDIKPLIVKRKLK